MDTVTALGRNMGCGASAILTGPTPPGAVDIIANASALGGRGGGDATHTIFTGALARADFMDPKLKPFVTRADYESVIQDVNNVIEARTASELCCYPNCGPSRQCCCLTLKYASIFVCAAIPLDYYIGESYRKLEACERILKEKWEAKTTGICVEFLPGKMGHEPKNNTIRVHVSPHVVGQYAY